jgi:predicted NBD/HSP70 family sugar kinase
VTLPPAFLPGPDTGAVSSRRLNRQRLLEAIRRFGPISRADLAKRTRLSPPTVSALVEELVSEVGLLREVGVGASSGGRPPVLLEFNAEFGCIVGVDLGLRQLRFALADLQGRLLAQRETRTRLQSADETIHQILEGVDAIVRESGQDARKLLAIAIGAPGATEVTSGRVRSLHLPGWAEVPLGGLVQSHFRAPVLVDNVANMAALGERWQGAARKATDFVFVLLDADVWAGVVIGGRLHRGEHWVAGGIGRMTLDYRAWQADQGPNGYLASRICVGPGEGRAGEEEFAILLGAAVANIVTVMDPGLVVFGGLTDSDPELLDRVRKVVSHIVPNVPSLHPSLLGDDARILGSVYAAMELAEAQIFTLAGSSGGLADVARRPGRRR